MIGIWQLSGVERAAILLFAALFVEEKGKEGNFLNGFRLVKIERARKFLTDSTGNGRAGSSAWTGWIGFEGFETPWRSRILEQSRIKRFRALIFPRIRGLSERWMPPSNCDISGYRQPRVTILTEEWRRDDSRRISSARFSKLLFFDGSLDLNGKNDLLNFYHDRREIWGVLFFNFLFFFTDDEK